MEAKDRKSSKSKKDVEATSNKRLHHWLWYFVFLIVSMVVSFYVFKISGKTFDEMVWYQKTIVIAYLILNLHFIFRFGSIKSEYTEGLDNDEDTNDNR
jgi:L-lactate permease